MRRIGKALMSLVCGMALLALGACDGDSRTEPRDQLTLMIAPSSSIVAVGENVTLTFTVANSGVSPIRFSYGNSCKADFTVASGGTVAWNLLASAICLQQVTTETLNPGQSYVFRQTWDLSKNSGGKVEPGTYTVFATLMSEERPTSPRITLTVR